MSHTMISLLVTPTHRPRNLSPRQVPRHRPGPFGFRNPTPLWIFTALLVLTPLLGATPAEAGDGLTLRVDDVDGTPGEVIAVEVRTYAPRGVGQGQICLRATDMLSPNTSGILGAGTGEDAALLGDGSAIRPGERAHPGVIRELVASSGLRSLTREATDAPRPLRSLEGVAVLSALGDAASDSFFDAGTQTADLGFRSPSASINEADGPLAVFYFRLDDDLKPDQEFLLAIDPKDTYIVDALGNQVPLELRGGRLRIREPDSDCKP